jgi:hypothetical protein
MKYIYHIFVLRVVVDKLFHLPHVISCLLQYVAWNLKYLSNTSWRNEIVTQDDFFFTSIYTYIHTYIHTYTHAYIHTYIHTQYTCIYIIWMCMVVYRYYVCILCIYMHVQRFL